MQSDDDNPWLQQDVTGLSGKYQHCSPAQDGLLYANCDFAYNERDEIKDGALPSPYQRTPEKTAHARRLHVEAAQAKMELQLGAILIAAKIARPKPSAWQRLRDRFRPFR